MHIILNIKGIHLFTGLFGGLMGKYMKCPRCELNWILETDEYCDVCKAEMGMEGFTLLEDEEEDILCPVCGINYIERNKKLCADCLAKSKSGNDAYVNDSDADDSEMGNQPEETQNDNEDGIEKISFDEINEEEKFDIYDDAFDDQDDFSANDFGKGEFDEDEETEEEEEEVNSEDDDFEADFNYDIDSVEDIDEDEEDEIDEDDEV